MIQVAMGILLALLILWAFPTILAIMPFFVVQSFHALAALAPLLMFALILGAVAVGWALFESNRGMKEQLKRQEAPKWTPVLRVPKPENPNGRTAQLRRKLGLPPKSENEANAAGEEHFLKNARSGNSEK